MLYIGRNLNLAIFQKVDTADNVCTKTDLGAFQGSPSQKGRHNWIFSVFSSHGSVIRRWSIKSILIWWGRDWCGRQELIRVIWQSGLLIVLTWSRIDLFWLRFLDRSPEQRCPCKLLSPTVIVKQAGWGPKTRHGTKETHAECYQILHKAPHTQVAIFRVTNAADSANADKESNKSPNCQPK